MVATDEDYYMMPIANCMHRHTARVQFSSAVLTIYYSALCSLFKFSEQNTRIKYIIVTIDGRILFTYYLAIDNVL